MTHTPTLPSIINDLDELGARIDAMVALGAGFATALSAQMIAPDDLYRLVATYSGGLLALQRKVRGDLSALDRCVTPSVECTGTTQ